MEKFSETLFWIITDIFLIFGLAFFPSVFSVFCFIAAIIFVPIEMWQNLLKKFLKKPIKPIIIAVIMAVIIANFPLLRVVNGVKDIINPPPTSSNFEVYYGLPENSSNNKASLDTKTSSNVSDEKPKVSSQASSAQTQTSVSQITTSHEEYNETSKEESKEESKTTQVSTIITNGEYVYRTPSGKRYHFSSTCGGKNSYEVSFDEAIADGLTPCKKCVK